jgi:hypothetical protein
MHISRPHFFFFIFLFLSRQPHAQLAPLVFLFQPATSSSGRDISQLGLFLFLSLILARMQALLLPGARGVAS